MANKDDLFWNAIENKKVGDKKKFRFKFRIRKSSKVVDSKKLAELYGVDPKEIETVYSAFMKIDEDKSGSISAPEIAQGLASLGLEVSPKVVQAVMRISDRNGDGEINFDEFLAVVISKSKLTVEMLQNAWCKGTNMSITTHETEALLALADTANEKVVTFEQFSAMWEHV
uniref:Calmodulin n=1 Tax=Syphacia muris TaxID=451379 RepID=A0A0N5AHM1_9BILA